MRAMAGPYKAGFTAWVAVAWRYHGFADSKQKAVPCPACTGGVTSYPAAGIPVVLLLYELFHALAVNYT